MLEKLPLLLVLVNLNIFFCIVDNYPSYSWIFHMKFRFELLQIYYNFAKMAETKYLKRIKNFLFDNALEYTQHVF